MNLISGDKLPDKTQGPVTGLLKQLGYDESNVSLWQGWNGCGDSGETAVLELCDVDETSVVQHAPR